jgi:hypothetical protein
VSDIPRCRTCKHFSRDGDDRGGPWIGRPNDRASADLRAELEAASAWAEAHEWGTCERIPHESVAPGDLAYVCDASSYSASLYPSADFGCIHHEETT